jgi:hypothetical protein
MPGGIKTSDRTTRTNSPVPRPTHQTPPNLHLHRDVGLVAGQLPYRKRRRAGVGGGSDEGTGGGGQPAIILR